MAFNDATDPHHTEAETVITEVNTLLALYDDIGMGKVKPQTNSYC